MQFLEAWTHFERDGFTQLHLIRLLVPAALMLLAVFLPGRRVARGLALGLAASIAALPDLGPTPLVAAWCALWLVVARLVGSGRRNGQLRVQRGGALESGTTGLLLGVLLLALMVVAVGREELSAEVTRRVSYGLLVVGLGLVHLMVRRDVARGMFALATLGLGLQVLERAAQDAAVPATASAGLSVWAGTALAVALASRITRARQIGAGSAWVSDAHDLHD